MKPRIVIEFNTDLPKAAESVLEELFSQRHTVIVKREFGNSRSGSRVYLVQPIASRGKELPQVVKFAAPSLIEREWHAYQRTHGMMYGMVEIQDLILPRSGPWGAIRYPFRGGHAFNATTLYNASITLPACELVPILDRLFITLQSIHDQSSATPGFYRRASYDHVLPPNLLVDKMTVSHEVQPPIISPDTVCHHRIRPGDWVCLEGFAVTKVDRVKQTITLNLPDNPDRDSFVVRSRWSATPPTYSEGEVIHNLTGRVITTREAQLEALVDQALGDLGDADDPTLLLADGTRLPNPLCDLSRLLDQYSSVRVSLIHGDLNLDNILVDVGTGHISLIDVTEAREDHVLHDFLRLETEVITKLLSRVVSMHQMAPDRTIYDLYRHLHCAVFETESSISLGPPHPELEKPFRIIRAIRRAAQRHLYSGAPEEYYEGLLIYLLGALKFSNLDQVPSAPLPKQLALWGAATVRSLLESDPGCHDISLSAIRLPSKPHALVIDYEPEVKLQRKGTNHLAQVEYGTHLYRDDVIYTLTDGYALIHCDKGPAFPVPPERTKVIDCDRVSAEELSTWPELGYPDHLPHLIEEFTTSRAETLTPHSPRLYSPRNTVVAQQRPSFQWRPVPGARGYRLQLRMPGGESWTRETAATSLAYPDNAPGLGRDSSNTIVLEALGTEEAPEATRLRCLKTEATAQVERTTAWIQQQPISETARRYLLARLYQRWEMWAAAAEELQQVLEKDGAVSVNFWLELAGLYVRMGLHDKAEASYKRAIAAVEADEPSLGAAYLGLAYLNQIRGETAQAIGHLEHVVQSEYSELAQNLIHRIKPGSAERRVYAGSLNLARYAQFLAEQIAPLLKAEMRRIADPLLAQLQRMDRFVLKTSDRWSYARLGTQDFQAMSFLTATYITTVTLVEECSNAGDRTQQFDQLPILARERATRIFSEVLGLTAEQAKTLADQYESLTIANSHVIQSLADQRDL